MKFLTSVAPIALFAATVAAHPGSPDPIPKVEEVARRTAGASQCAGHIQKRNTHMMNQRRNTINLAGETRDTFYHELQNKTCVLSQEATQGPYYIIEDLVRNDLIEDQSGQKLVLDIGLIDIITCEPLPNAYVDIWSANATGVYSGFTNFTLDAPSKRQMNTPSDNYTFLRGTAKTDEEGMVEFNTIFPGYYTGRTGHIHLMVHDGAYENDDGGISGGQTIHTSQIFADDDISNQIFSKAPYTDNTQERTTNDDDSILQNLISGGDWPFMNYQFIDDVMYAAITFGVNSTATGNDGSNVGM